MWSFRALLFTVAVALIVPLAASASDRNVIDGTWATIVTTPLGNGHPTFRLTQAGASIQGSYLGQFGPQSVQGTIRGNNVELRLIVSNRGATNGPILYTGTISGDTMQGTVSISNAVHGTFTAERISTSASD